MTTEHPSRPPTAEEDGPRSETEADAPRSQTGPSRRRLIKSGVLAASVALVGGSGSVGASGSDDDPDATSDLRGAMFPYQFTPDARFTVVESGLEWRPRGVDRNFVTHVIEYERARSFRAFFFAETGFDDGETMRTTGRRASPLSDGRTLVGVVTEPVEG